MILDQNSHLLPSLTSGMPKALGGFVKSAVRATRFFGDLYRDHTIIVFFSGKGRSMTG